MKKSILWFFSLCLLACGFLTSCEKQNATNEELIIGTWKIHSISEYIADELKDKYYPEYDEGESFSWTFKQNGVWIEEYNGDAVHTHHYEIEEDKLFLISNGGGVTLFKIVSIDSQKMKVRYSPEDEDNYSYVYELKKQ